MSSSVKSLESSFLQFIQSYKSVFNTTYSQLQTDQGQHSEQTMMQKKILIDSFYQSYKAVISSIDALQQIDTSSQSQKTQNTNSIKSQDPQNPTKSKAQINSYSSGQNIDGLNAVQSKYERYERQICQSHDKAVHRYKKAILHADVWKQKLYMFINQNLPSGNH